MQGEMGKHQALTFRFALRCDSAVGGRNYSWLLSTCRNVSSKNDNLAKHTLHCVTSFDQILMTMLKSLE